MARDTHPKVKKSQKQEVIDLANQGLSVEAICEQMQVNPNSVGGIITNAKRTGHIPRANGQFGPVPPPAAAAMPPAAPRADRSSTSKPRTQAMPPPPSQTDDGQIWAPAEAGTGGFVHPTQKVKYLVFRSPEGLVGSHTQSPTDDDLGVRYGQGVFTVEKHVPGRMPESRETTVSLAFGAPKFPRAVPAPAPAEPERPASRLGRWPRYNREAMVGDDGQPVRIQYPQYPQR